MEPEHTTHQKPARLTLSEIASTCKEQSVTCPSCQGSGEREYQVTRLTNFFNPYDYQTGPCDECQGEGSVTIEVCPLCGRQESECARTCKPPICCGRHPVNCECPDGLALYQKVYGVPKEPFEVQIDLDERCFNPATTIVREPYTPAAFEVHCCDHCARSLIHQGYLAPMSLKRVETAIKDAYKSAPCGSRIETWYFDALLEVILIAQKETREARVAA